MTTRLGFIGFGIMGERLLKAALTHDRAIVTVSGIFDPSLSAATRLRAIDPSLPVFARADELIAASDCLHIASPPLSHLDYLARCHASGKAALCEKPLAVDTTSATAAVAQLKAGNIRAGVNFPFASMPAVEHLQRWMTDGTVGAPERVEILMAFAAWPRPWQMDAMRWLDARAEGGFLREVGSHFLFLSRRLLGPLALVSANSPVFAEPNRSEHRIEARLTAGGLPVHMHGEVGATALADHNTWTLTGTQGRVRLRDWAIAERFVDGAWAAPQDAVSNEVGRPLVLARQLDKIAAMTRGAATNLATLDEALDVQCMVETILATP